MNNSKLLLIGVLVIYLEFYWLSRRRTLEHEQICKEAAGKQSEELYQNTQKKIDKLIERVEHMQGILTAEERKHEELTTLEKKHAQKLVNLNLELLVETQKRSEPTMKYEKHRRRVKRNIQNLWETFKTKMNVAKTKNLKCAVDLDSFWTDVYDHKLFLLNDINQLTKSDNYDLWRHQTAKKLGDRVQSMLHHLQHPADCNKAKILRCYNDFSNCGWGCQVHHITECLTMALGMDRTFTYDSTGFKYGDGSLEKAYQKIDPENCTFGNIKEYPHYVIDGNQSERVILLQRSYEIHLMGKRPKYLPSAVPTYLFPVLEKLNEIPVAWWIGQINKFALKFTTSAQKSITEQRRKLNFRNPIVGLQVRRTDKVSIEARVHGLEEYMQHVEEYFDLLDLSTNSKNSRRIFLASEDPNVIKEAQQKYPNYEIIYNMEAANISYDLETRYSTKAFLGTVTDIELLSSCDFVVCTFSSNICRIILESKQTQMPDASSLVKSVDFIYNNYSENEPLAKVVMLSKATADWKLNVGSLLVVDCRHNRDGDFWVKNPVDNRTGAFPAFLVDIQPEIVDFPVKFDMI